jgi:hypothetical protein
MVQSTDTGLIAWTRSVLPDVEVSLARPAADDPEGRGVGLYLLELRQRPPLRSTRPEPLQLAVQYLVRTWAPDPSDAHAMLLDLAFAAMEEPDFQVELDPPPPELWSALGVPPGPTFRLQLPVRRERPQRPVKPVLHPLVVEPTALGTLAGWVRTPDDQAISGATVDVPDLERQSITDRDGRFWFEALPGRGRRLELRVRAKGREVWATVAADETERDQVLIRLDPLEGSNGGIPHS